MEVKVIEKKQNELKLEIGNLTLCEALRKELWNDKNVVRASYKREHPTKNPVMHLLTEGKTPKKALQDAIKRLEKKGDELAKEFKNAVK